MEECQREIEETADLCHLDFVRPKMKKVIWENIFGEIQEKIPTMKQTV